MKYFIIAGDYSGQLKGKDLMKSISLNDADAKFFIFGSELMKLSNSEILFDFKSLKIMGFLDVLIHIFKLKKVLQSCKNAILEYKPDSIILIDYAGFNLRIAKFAKENSFKVIYFIPPKVWAWNEKRIEQLKKYCDEIIVIFKFEFDYFKSKLLETHYFGNPDADFLLSNFKQKTRIKNQIVLMPGSRQSEVDNSICVFEKLIKYRQDLNFIIAGVDNIKYNLSKKYNNIKIQYNCNFQLMQESEFGFIVSGTANFEASTLKLPHVVCYKTNFINYFIAKILIKVKFIALSNLILNKILVKELIQKDFNYTKCNAILDNFYQEKSFIKSQIEGFEAIQKIEFANEVYKKIAQKVVLVSKKA